MVFLARWYFGSFSDKPLILVAIILRSVYISAAIVNAAQTGLQWISYTGRHTLFTAN
jgi:hypothetical protein